MSRPASARAVPGSAPMNYTVRVVRFAVVREAAAPPRTLSTPDAVAALARELIPDDTREHFGVFFLNTGNGLVAYHEVSTGTLSASLVHPREVFGPDLVVLDQSIDTTTPSGRLLFHILAAIAEFERDLIRDRVMAGLRRAKAQGRHLGRPRRYHIDGAEVRTLLAEGLSLRAIARRLNAHPMAVRRALARA
jgi:hypothetical protein